MHGAKVHERMPLLYALSYAPCAPIATQHHARHGAAPPAHQHCHAGPCSWRYALATPALQCNACYHRSLSQDIKPNARAPRGQWPSGFPPLPSCGWAGLIFPRKCPRPGTKGFAVLQCAYDFLCLIYNTQKMSGHRERCQGSFDPRPELHARNVFWASQWGFGGATPCAKTSSKIPKLNT